MPVIPPGCAGCNLQSETLYENKYLRREDREKHKPPWKWHKPPYWNPPSIYQRSYMPVVVGFLSLHIHDGTTVVIHSPLQSDMVIARPPKSTWKRPTVRLDGISSYTHDYSGGAFLRPKWTHHPHELGKKAPEVRTSEYADRFHVLTKKQFEKATKRVDVPVKINSRRSAAFLRNVIKPPMFTNTIYSTTYVQHSPPSRPPVTTK
ncbi:hypothetical protein BV898_15854 [Hypsibius exemplaris]|uniref:Uncharacterized protein n=1 Tax=Hypsibius exemplaris TaxID=2072580 RepID=A0A9X6NER3_HYPEX|nr:hypothetical protein BV898_15854 [Hypsibius exemplaris]